MKGGSEIWIFVEVCESEIVTRACRTVEFQSGDRSVMLVFAAPMSVAESSWREVLSNLADIFRDVPIDHVVVRRVK